MKFIAIVSLAASGWLVAPAALAMGSSPKGDEEAANVRILPIAKVALAPVQKQATGPRSGEDIYKAACAACHDTGAANAPKVGDKNAWAPRIKQGLSMLVKDAIKGVRAMPPRGGSNATDAEMEAAVVYMANRSGANFK